MNVRLGSVVDPYLYSYPGSPVAGPALTSESGCGWRPGFLCGDQVIAEVATAQPDERRDQAGEEMAPAHAVELPATQAELAGEELQRHERHVKGARRDAPRDLLGGLHLETVPFQTSDEIGEIGEAFDRPAPGHVAEQCRVPSPQPDAPLHEAVSDHYPRAPPEHPRALRDPRLLPR